MSERLVYVGKVVSLESIPSADRILSATVVCGPGGKWRGVVQKDKWKVGDLCRVYLPDSIIPENPEMKFMESSKWRVKMQRFRGAPSEVVIMPHSELAGVGTDLTFYLGVKRYIKPMPACLNGESIGDFPSFLRKTDENNYQIVPVEISKLQGKPYYITEKADGSSTTAYKYNGVFGLCSRNLELKPSESGYWQIARKYGLETRLPEGFAIQWETCGPGIQSNPMGLTELAAFAFNVFDIENQKYLAYLDMWEFLLRIEFPIARLVAHGREFNPENMADLAKIKYPNGEWAEGIVIRSQEPIAGNIVSFKVINLEYED